MRRGLTALETAILMAVVAAAIAYVGTAFMQPKNVVTNKPIMIVYDAEHVTSTATKSAQELCAEVAQALYSAGALNSPKPVIIGNANSKYAIILIVNVMQPGYVQGVTIRDAFGNVLSAFNANAFIPPGRRAICVLTDTKPIDVKVELLGAQMECIKCTTQ